MKKRKLSPLETGFHIFFLICGILSVAFVLFISIYLIISGLPAILKVGPIKFLFGQKWAAGTENFGILSFILTSIYGTAGAEVHKPPQQRILRLAAKGTTLCFHIKHAPF